MSNGFGDKKMAPPAPPLPRHRERPGLRARPDAALQGRAVRRGEDLEFQGQLEGNDRTHAFPEHRQGRRRDRQHQGEVRDLEGRVDGDIYATESVQVRQSAKVKGNIYAPRVGIADGAQFSGSIDMNHKGIAGATRPATIPVGTLSDPAAERLLTKAG